MPGKPRPRRVSKRRRCLRCDRVFASEGAHHRLCRTCRQVLDYGPSPTPTYRLRWAREPEE
jgi:hypothetical protein